MAPLFNSTLEVLLGKIAANAKSGAAFNIYDLYKGLTMDAIGRTAFGIESNVQDNPQHPLLKGAKILLSRRFHSILHILGYSFREFRHLFSYAGLFALTLRNKGVNPLNEILETCKDVIDMRKNDISLSRPDILQTMIDARSTDGIIDNKQLEATVETEGKEAKSEGTSKKTYERSEKATLKLLDREIISNALLFFLAGYETTSTALAFITHVLVNKQDVQEKLRSEIREQLDQQEVDYNSIQNLAYMDRVIMEVLRLYPPIYNFVSRYSTQEVQLGKWKIPANSTIQIPVHFIHHDPEIWSEPETFNPDRFLPENRTSDHSMKWLPFGAGPRNCVGMRFALLEMKLALSHMLKNYRFEPCEETEKENCLTIEPSANILRPYKGIFTRAVTLK